MQAGAAFRGKDPCLPRGCGSCRAGERNRCLRFRQLVIDRQANWIEIEVPFESRLSLIRQEGFIPKLADVLDHFQHRLVTVPRFLLHRAGTDGIESFGNGEMSGHLARWRRRLTLNIVERLIDRLSLERFSQGEQFVEDHAHAEDIRAFVHRLVAYLFG